MIVIIETPGKTKKRQNEPGLRFDRWTNIYLGIQARVRRLGNRTLVTEDASETPLCFGSSIVEPIFAYDRCEWCWKTLNNTWFWAFVGETQSRGSPLGFFKRSGRFYSRWVLWDDSRDVFFFYRHHPWGVSIILLASLGTYLVLSPYKVLLWNRSESILLTLALVSLAA